MRLRRLEGRVYCVVGDGELQEGQIWEAVMTSAQYRLDRVCMIVMDNGLQIDGEVARIKNVRPVADRLRAFGWHAVDIDGHDLIAVLAAFEEFRRTAGRPTAVVARTVMGKGVSYMENLAEWHGKAPSREQAVQALREIPDGFAPDLWTGDTR
jgi:transketolase